MIAKVLPRIGLCAAVVVLCLLPEMASSQVTGVLGTSISRSASVRLGYPLGWYDLLYKPGNLADMQAEGVGDVLPYGIGSGLSPYLNAAAAAGSGVFVEVDPTSVKAGDVDAVVAEVNTYKGYPALRGWYLADEPTFSGSMTAATGVTLYDAIKVADPLHPVAIAFNASEDATPYANAMDVMMWDYYPCMAGSAEFTNLDLWHTHLASSAQRWRTDHRFVPIVQAFGPVGAKYTQWREPTAAEERYMVYASLQTGVDGLFFWSHYAADPTWLTGVFDPLMREVQGVLPAVKAGAVGKVVSLSAQVTATLFRDPRTKRFVLIAINNEPTSVRATIVLPRGVLAQGRRITPSFTSFGARVFRF